MHSSHSPGLSEKQIAMLFAFCQKHHVHFYDVQCELVDHLVNAIEEMMKDSPALAFEPALEKVYAGFGVMGFSDIVKNRSYSLARQYNKMRKRFFCSYFTPPKLALTVCLFLLASFPFWFLQASQLSWYSGILLLLLWGIEIGMMRKDRTMAAKQDRRLLMTIAGSAQNWLSSFLMTEIVLIFFFHDDTMGPFNTFLGFECVILIATLFFIGLLAYRDTILQMDALARKQYPLAFPGIN